MFPNVFIRLGNKKIVELLINESADDIVNTPNAIGRTPLFLALSKGKTIE